MSERDFLSDFQKSLSQQGPTLEQISFARKMVKEHLESLALIHQAALAGNYDWAQKFEIPWFGKVKLPRIAFLLFEARLAGCAAYLEYLDGQYGKVLESLRDGFMIAEPCRGSRFLISEMIGEAIPKMLLTNVRRISRIPPNLLEKVLRPLLGPWGNRSKVWRYD
jgi:hypothetical protein